MNACEKPKILRELIVNGVKRFKTAFDNVTTICLYSSCHLGELDNVRRKICQK